MSFTSIRSLKFVIPTSVPTLFAAGLVVTGLFISSRATASDLMKMTSADGTTCAQELETIASRKLGFPVRAIAFVNLTPGSWYQKYAGRVIDAKNRAYDLTLTGEFDCDALRVESISPVASVGANSTK